VLDSTASNDAAATGLANDMVGSEAAKGGVQTSADRAAIPLSYLDVPSSTGGDGATEDT
jgi:hypothetical protein